MADDREESGHESAPKETPNNTGRPSRSIENFIQTEYERQKVILALSITQNMREFS